MNQKAHAYIEFLKSKIVVADESGFQITEADINPILKPHQRDSVLWAVRGGRRALFESFGLGKTIIQLEIIRLILKEKGGKGLVVCPLGVKQEFAHDAEALLGIRIRYVRTMEECQAAEESILITNYERVRDGDIDPNYFTVCSLDEASVLRSYGSKTYQEFLPLFSRVPYRFVCTATPSPNRFKELIHYAGFLGVMDTGQALAQPLTSRVLTPDGWSMMGDLKQGDMVIGRNGEPTRILNVFPQGEKGIYRVTFSDGASVRCTADHLWLTRTQYERNAATKFRRRNPGKDSSHYWTVKDTATIAQTLFCKSTGAKNHQVPLVEPVSFPAREVVVNPYLLGYLLGNGHIRSTSIGFTTADVWVVELISRIVSGHGLMVRKNPHQRSDGKPNYDYSISAGPAGKTGRGHESNDVLRGLRGYGLLEKRSWEKKIPDEYLFNAKEIRLEVLRGLMDSDGTIAHDERNRTVRFCTVSRDLADGVVFIVQSLGGTAQTFRRKGRKPNGEQGRDRFIVTIRLPNGTNPFSLPRKADLVVDRSKYVPTRYIVSVEPDGSEQAQCIAVADPERLYVTDDVVVTHNTRFFQRDSSQANNLTLYPHKEEEFWLWVSTWALFITKPSDLGYDDTGYDLPPMEVFYHEVGVDHATAGAERDGQVKLFRDAALGLKDASREKRDSTHTRIQKMSEIIAADPESHYIIWHDLEYERDAIKKALPDAVEVYGNLDLETREQRIIDFSYGKIKYLATKPVISGSGCNFQRFCHKAIFLGIGYKFNDFIQAIHRIYRFLQTERVEIHVIYTESERAILDVLKQKWEQHEHLVRNMIAIMRRYGLSSTNVMEKLARTIGVSRQVATGGRFTAIHNDCVLECYDIPDNSIDLIHTSIPFGNHYEYSPSYNDFGHNEDNDRFFEQMDYLTPELLRILKPGRVCAVHVKDRILFGNATGTGMPTVDPFSDLTTAHYMKHGFQFFGRITILTDVVRENNQTYRLGWTEQCKDGSKMGVGCPEYILLFRKLPSDTSRAYADEPVAKTKQEYTRAQWQIDANAFWRSSGNRLLTREELLEVPVDSLQGVYRNFSRENVYNYAEHVALAKNLEDQRKLPASFSVVAPGSWSPMIWDDINRMYTLNSDQARKGVQMHICPLQFDIVERIITRFSNRGDVVLDPFAGLMTVPYMAVKLGRKGIGIELTYDSWKDGVGYLKAAEIEAAAPTLFDLVEVAQ